MRSAIEKAICGLLITQLLNLFLVQLSSMAGGNGGIGKIRTEISNKTAF